MGRQQHPNGILILNVKQGVSVIGERPKVGQRLFCNNLYKVLPGVDGFKRQGLGDQTALGHCRCILGNWEFDNEAPPRAECREGCIRTGVSTQHIGTEPPGFALLEDVVAVIVSDGG